MQEKDMLFKIKSRFGRAVYVSVLAALPALAFTLLFSLCPITWPLAIATLCAFPLLIVLCMIQTYTLGYFK